jgi:transcriptional regulator with XRE-family HTH domain
MAFAVRLRQLRENASLTVYALAKRCGLTKQALYRLEQGDNEPTWQTVQLLAAALGVECTSFLDPNLKPPAEEPAKPRGRPRKEDAPSANSAKRAPKKGKGTGKS